MKIYFLLATIVLLSFESNSQNFLWTKKIDTKYASSLNMSNMKIDPSNNIIIAGLFSETIDFDLGTGVYNLVPSGGPNLDVFIAKYSPNGDFIWAKKIAGHDWTQLWDFTVDKYGNVILSLFTNDVVDLDPSVNVYNVGTLGIRTSILVKYTAAGNLDWADTFSENANFSRIYTNSMGQVIAAGNFRNLVDFNPSATATYTMNVSGNATNLFIARYNATGSFGWVKRIGDSSNFANDVYDVRLDSLNNIFIAGRFNGNLDMDPSTNKYYLNSQGKYIGYYGKYTSNGTFVHARSFYTSGNSLVKNIRIDKKNNIILSGRYTGTMDLDASASTLTVSAGSTYDIFITKYGPTGNIKWGFDIGNTSEEILTNHELSPNGNLYLFGRFKGTVDFDPSSNTSNLVSTGTSQADLFLATYDTLGALKNASKLGNSSAENPVSCSLNKSGDLCLFGNFAGTVDFDFSTATYTIAATDQDFFISKYNFNLSNFKISEEETSMESLLLKEQQNPFIIYPNPIENQLNIKNTPSSKIEQIQIYNSNGTNVFNTNIDFIQENSVPYTIDLTHLAPGFYTIRINNTYSKNFIKQ